MISPIRFAALTLGLTVAGSALAGPLERHNGTWSVRMVTDAGVCDASYSYAIAIQDGAVRYLQAPGDSPTTVDGRIGPDGTVNLDIRRSIAKVDAAGRLSEKSGSGTWHLGMLGCSGRWTASKRAETVSN
jgi:hypothetical protein